VGARIIANMVIDDKSLFLLKIYNKSENEKLTNKGLIELIESINE